MYSRGKEVKKSLENCIYEPNAARPDDKNKCPAVAYQAAGVCVPVTVAPYASVGTPVTTCFGDPFVTSETPSCASRKNGTCTFTITQFVCIEIPVYFGANASSRDAYVTCLGATSEDICTECGVAHDDAL